MPKWFFYLSLCRRGPSVSTPPKRRPIAGGDSLGLDEEIFYFTGTPVVSEAEEDEPNFSPHSSPSPKTPKPGTSRTNISTQVCLWIMKIHHLNVSKLPTTLQSMMNAKLSLHGFWQCHENGIIKPIKMIPHNLYVSFKSASLYWGLG